MIRTWLVQGDQAIRSRERVLNSMLRKRPDQRKAPASFHQRATSTVPSREKNEGEGVDVLDEAKRERGNVVSVAKSETRTRLCSTSSRLGE